MSKLAACLMYPLIHIAIHTYIHKYIHNYGYTVVIAYTEIYYIHTYWVLSTFRSLLVQQQQTLTTRTTTVKCIYTYVYNCIYMLTQLYIHIHTYIHMWAHNIDFLLVLAHFFYSCSISLHFIALFCTFFL